MKVKKINLQQESILVTITPKMSEYFKVAI